MAVLPGNDDIQRFLQQQKLMGLTPQQRLKQAQNSNIAQNIQDFLPDFIGGSSGGQYAPSPVQYGTIANPPSAGSNGKSGGGPDSSGSGIPSFDEWLKSMGLSGSSMGGGNTVDTDVPNYSGMVSDQFDPALAYLHKSIKRTNRKGDKASDQLKAIYGAGAKMAKNTAKKINRQGNRGEDRMMKQAEGLADRTANNSKRTQNQTIDELKRLGIEDASNAAVQDTRKDLQRNQVFQSNRANAERNALDRQNSNWSNYARAQAINSRLEGANARADLGSQVRDLVFGLQGQIAQTKSEQASAVLQAQMQENQMRMQAEQFNAGQSNTADSMRAGMVDNYQGDIAQLLEAAQGGGAAPGDKPELQGWDAISNEYRNYLKGSGQNSGAPVRNTDEVMNFMQSALGNMGPTAYGETMDQSTFLSKLMQMYNDQGGYQGTGVPSDAISRVGLPVYNQFYK